MDLSARTILVVDDLAALRRVLTQMLQRLGAAQTLEAADGVTALQCLQTQPVDLVTLDWHLPGMSGLDLLQAIRAAPRWRTMPVLTITVESSPEAMRVAYHAGANAYLVKPFPQELLAEQLMGLWGPAPTPHASV
jgi:two-component system chemotaxis response regulator CheY